MKTPKHQTESVQKRIYTNKLQHKINIRIKIFDKNTIIEDQKEKDIVNRAIFNLTKKICFDFIIAKFWFCFDLKYFGLVWSFDVRIL